MRKRFGLALLTGLLIIGCTFFNPSSSNTSNSETLDGPETAPPTPPVSVEEQQSHQIAELHHDDLPVPSPGALEASTRTVVAQPVIYGNIDNYELTGYLAQPENVTGPIPGVIVIQEWWGLTEGIQAMTRRLAGEGFAVLAVDLYDDQVAETPEQARVLVQEAMANADRLEQNLVTAYTYLTEVLEAPTVASLGWCFGGTWSLNTGLALPTELDAVVIYYGGQITTERDRLETLQMPIQGHFGELDTSPSPETVAEFESTLDDLGKSAEIYLYENANHAFANPSGNRYNPEAAELAWERTINFLNQHLYGTIGG